MKKKRRKSRGSAEAECLALLCSSHSRYRHRGNLPHIDRPGQAVARQRESIWPTQGKEGYFFIYYPPLSLLGRAGSAAFGGRRPSVDRRGDDEIWDTWLDLKRRHSTLNRRLGARIMLH